MLDKKVIMLTGMIGAVGGLGICLGISLNSSKLVSKKLTFVNTNNSLSLPIWIFWVLIGFYLSKINTPKDTIFASGYMDSTSQIEGLNFASAWMMSYVILTFVFCDIFFESNRQIKKIKTWILFPILLYIIIFFQFLRGDRECLPWAFGLILAYIYWGKKNKDGSTVKFPFKKIFTFVLLIFIMAFVVGISRSAVSGMDLYQTFNLLLEYKKEGLFDISNFFTGTWSGVLLTPLSVAGDHINNLLSINYGKDYLNLLLSVPPGFLSDLFGYTRPIDGLTGPAWQMRYGMGGTHASVVPFLNFRMVGVFLIPFFWSFLINKFERQTINNPNVINLSFLVSFTMAAPHWLWYGEKAGMNALILWLILSFFYKLSLSIKLHY
jgi:hypothetical protein